MGLIVVDQGQGMPGLIMVVMDLMMFSDDSWLMMLDGGESTSLITMINRCILVGSRLIVAANGYWFMTKSIFRDSFSSVHV